MTTLTRRRPMRSEQLVSLRSTMPVQLVTLHHQIPRYLTKAAAELLEAGDDTTTQQVPAPITGPRETAARKGGEAR